MTYRRLRTILNCTCHAPGANVQFGVPVDLRFGDVAQEGTSTAFSRADHRHGMPPSPSAVIESLLQGGFAFSELAVTNAVSGSPTTGIITRQGLAVVLGEDNADGTGGFGTIRINTATASPGQASALIVMTNVSAGSFSGNTGTQSLTSLKEFQASCHPQKQLGTGIPTFCDMAVGGFVFNIPDGANFHVNDIVAGIGFLGQFDVGGAGNWFAVIYSGGLQTESVDTGVPLSINTTTGLVSNQRFVILREGDDFGFFINGVLVAVMEEPTLPTTLVNGFGAYMDHVPRTTNHSLFVDHLLIRGRRFGQP